MHPRLDGLALVDSPPWVWWGSPASAAALLGPTDLAAGLVRAPAWAIGLLGVLVAAAVLAALLVRRRKRPRP